MTLEALIETAGGVGKFAAVMGVSTSTVYDWKNIGRLPGMRLSHARAAFGLTAEQALALADAAPSVAAS